MNEAAPITLGKRMTPTVRRFGPFAARSVAPVGAAVVACIVIGGLVATAAGFGLGAPLAPFFASWDPQLTARALPAAILLGAGVAWVPALVSRFSPLAFAASSFGLSLALALALSAARGGFSAWSAVFASSPEAANEYLPALPALSQGVGVFLDRFAELAPTLPIHPSAHPPGLLILIDALGIATPKALAALVIGAGATTAPLCYLLGRQLVDERRARHAALLWCFSPAALLYVATSADALFAALGTAAALALVARRRVMLVAGPVLLAIASFFSYALLAAGTWAGVVLIRRDGLRRAVGVGALCALSLAIFYGALYALTGFDSIGAVRAAHDAYVLGIAGTRPYLFWVVASPAAFLVACGLPVMWFALRSLGERAPAAVALAGVISSAALIGLTKAETERIWLFMVPFACIAAAGTLPARWLRPALALMAIQALVVQLFLETVW